MRVITGKVLMTLIVHKATFNYCRPFVNKFVSFEFGKVIFYQDTYGT